MQPSAPREILDKFNFCQADDEPVSNVRVSLMDGSNTQNEITIRQILQSTSGPSRIPAQMIPCRGFVEEDEVDPSEYYFGTLPPKAPDQEAKTTTQTGNNEPKNTEDPE
ncbi:hypothetical protein Ddc_00369 [Ditylenchus destructor]|nr:hypothetical protein Ddc_00369 [Ditylenchus destructor]